jgi:hypothetical protein
MLLLNSSWSYGARAAVEQLQEANRIVVLLCMLPKKQLPHKPQPWVPPKLPKMRRKMGSCTHIGKTRY